MQYRDPEPSRFAHNLQKQKMDLSRLFGSASLGRPFRLVVFPSSSSPKGHPAGPSRRATGGGRPPGGACAGPGAHCGVGPAWVARGLFPAEQPSNPATGAKSEDAHFTSVFSSNHRLACAVSRLSALEPSRRRPLEGPPRGQGRRVTGRPSPPRSKNRAAAAGWENFNWPLA